jgi:hypothetical protein
MYMVDASGLSIDEGISAENRSTQAKIDTFVEKTNLQSMIHLMAEETGGKAILNRNDITTPLEEMKGTTARTTRSATGASARAASAPARSR